MIDIVTFPLNTPLQFFGVDNNQFKLGGLIYEAIEDPDDGYRSYLGSIEVVDADLSIFFQTPLDTVVAVEMDRDNCRGWQLQSTTDGHVWLEMGTDYDDSYYPCFMFRYHPRVG